MKENVSQNPTFQTTKIDPPCTLLLHHHSPGQKVSVVLHSGEEAASALDGGGSVNLGHPAAEALQLMRERERERNEREEG